MRPAESDDGSFLRLTSQDVSIDPRAPFPPNRPSFDAIGQRDETVRQRIDLMVDRLEDIKSLQNDFAELMGPLVKITEDLSSSSVRIAELEALLAQQSQDGASHREKAANLTARLTVVGSALSDAKMRADQNEVALQNSLALGNELQVDLRDKVILVEDLERRIFSVNEHNNALIGENKALRAEAQTVDTALARSEHDLLGARERLDVLDQDNRRLQLLSEEQAGQLADLGGRHSDLEAFADQERHRTRALESQLANAVTARERSEAQLEAETGAHRSERAGLLMKLESAENRASSFEQMVSQARNQLREKDEAYRLADRNLKEASIARQTAERRLESVQAELTRHAERIIEMQRQRAELDARCDMLTKAVAAKDATLDQAGSRNAGLNERMEQLSANHDAVRSELETANRRLTEDLQNERSERALIQGALEIARESRLSLQKQYESLRRLGRGWRDNPQDDGSDTAEKNVASDSNVRPISAASKPQRESG